MGYIAPELTITGKPTTSTGVFAFGMFMLEVVCGRCPILLHSLEEENLVDWLLQCQENGEILKTSDPRLEGNYIAEEMELILRLALICCHNNRQERPSMRNVLQALDDSNSRGSKDTYTESCEPSAPYPPSPDFASVCSVSSTNSLLLHGR
ncbi:putative L-type lectin-domain containing receptor kinase V.2 [Bienertia sinuspersici]